MIIKKIVLFLFIVSFFTSVLSFTKLNAQSTYSPYSVLGLGELESREYAKTAGMGGIGIGMRDYDFLNTLNPAALTALDSLRFIFDFSASAKGSSFSSRSNKDNTFNANFRKLAFGFQAMPSWYMALGLKPFSDVGYQIYSSEPIEGTTRTKDVYLEGSGGLYQIYFSNAFKLNKNLSLGVNAMYIAGNIEQTENQTDYLFTDKSSASQFYGTLGLQYHSAKWTAGVTYGYEQKLSMENKILVYDSDNTLVEEIKKRSSSMFIPQTIGAGFSYTNEKIVIGADYQYQAWNGLNSGMDNVKITDSHQLKLGMGYTPDYNYYRIKTGGQYQIGTTFSKSYIQIKDKDAVNFSVTMGYSFPLRRESYLNFGLEYGNTLSAPSGYIRESYFMLSFNYTFLESLFKRNKIR